MHNDKDGQSLLIRKPFDLQEAVVLLDIYLSVVKKGGTLTQASGIASARLRNLAVNNGYKISGSFRSPQGLLNRLRSIGALYECAEAKGAPGTVIFAEAVALYKKERIRYKEILDSAKDIFGSMNTLKCVKSPLDVQVQKNWIHFDFTNSRDFERTIPVFCSVGGETIAGKNWVRILVGITELEISKNNPALDELYRTSLITHRGDSPFLMKKKTDGLNCSKLTNGYWINVNYNIPRLMEQILALCLHCGYKKEEILIYGVPKENLPNAEKRTFSGLNGNKISIDKAEEFLRSAGLRGATVKELIGAVEPGASVSSMAQVLEKSLNVICMPGKRYVHVEKLVDLDEAEEKLGKILKTHFAQFGGYSNKQLLFGAASKDLSMFLNDNDCENIDAVFAIARFLFEKKAAAGRPYKFYTPHIFEAEPDFPMTLQGLMINLARANGGVLQAVEAKSYLQKTMLTYGGLGQLLQIGTADTFLVYDSERYLLGEYLAVNDTWCSRMHDRMDDLFRQADVAYVIPRDISTAWLRTLPALPRRLEWTHLLLQEVLKKYPAIGFKVISPDLNQTHGTLAAAFVPLGSPLQSFPDVVNLYMEEHHTLPRRMKGEELRMELRGAGMLEGGEMIYALPKALDDYRFAWSNGNKTVYIRGS